MADLVALSPAAGLLPVSQGDITLREAPVGPITWVAPFAGKTAAVSKALKTAAGIAFPETGRFTRSGEVSAVWVGPGQALIVGAEVAPDGAACVDQSDAWAHLALDGPGGRDVLARLTPLDLRDGEFDEGQAARTLLFHMTASLWRAGPQRWEMLVFRSMAATAVHDIEVAMRRVAARA